MRLMDDGNGWLVTYTDLQSLVGKLGLAVNPLGVTAGQVPRPSDSLEQEWSEYSAGQQEALRAILTTLYNPRQIMQLAWTIGDVVFQYSTIFWGYAPSNELVWLTRLGEEKQYQLQSVTAEEVSRLLTDLVGAASLSDDNSNQSLSAAALLGLLGASEVMKQRYHQSMLNHHTIEPGFNGEQVHSFLAESSQVDARWVLCFWEKTLPIDMTLLAKQAKDVLPQLVQAGWIQAAADGNFQFTEAGLLLVEEILNEKAKLAITIATTDGEEILIEETILLVRGPQSLWLFSINGDQGGIGRVGNSGWPALTEVLFRAPLQNELKVNSDPEVDKQLRFCPQCGAGIVIGGQFCSSCGKAL